MAKINVPGVKVYWSNGRRYAYHRATGKRVRAPYGTAAFLEEVERLNAGEARPEPKAGTLGALISIYRGSPEFTELAPRTKTDYQRVLNYLSPVAGDLLTDITPAYVIEARDAAFIAHKRRFANYVVALLSVLLKFAGARELVDLNAAAGVQKLRRPRQTRKAHPAWTEAECDVVLSESRGGIMTATALGRFVGMRQGDALVVTPVNYDGAWLSWVQNKTGNQCDVPVDPRLKAILDQIVETRQRDTVVTLGRPLPFVLNESGRPYTGNGFRTLFFRLLRRLAKEGKVRPGLTFHGLRHTIGREIIEKGGTQRGAGAVLGHKTAAMTALYTEEADRKKLAAAAVRRLAPRRPRNVTGTENV